MRRCAGLAESFLAAIEDEKRARPHFATIEREVESACEARGLSRLAHRASHMNAPLLSFSRGYKCGTRLDAHDKVPAREVPYEFAPRFIPKVPDVVGGDELVAKQSAVNEPGKLRAQPIDGVIFRPVRPVLHEDGHVTEVARASWRELADPVVQVHLTTTFPGRVRAWGLHQARTDRLFVVSGLVKIAVYDGRRDSSTFGRLNEFTVSEKNPGLLIIPPNLYHGWKNIGTCEAIIINMPTAMYCYEAPDALDLPWDSGAAARIVPYQW